MTGKAVRFLKIINLALKVSLRKLSGRGVVGFEIGHRDYSVQEFIT